HGMADQGQAVEILGFDQCRDVVGEGVEVVAACRLVRTPMAAAIEADAAKAFGNQRRELVVPHPRAEPHAVQEEDGRALTPFHIVERRSVRWFEAGHHLPPALAAPLPYPLSPVSNP